MGRQSVGQAARRPALDPQAARRTERVDRERWLEGLAVEVLTALVHEMRRSPRLKTRRAVLQAMINDEHVTVPGDGAMVHGNDQPP